MKHSTPPNEALERIVEAFWQGGSSTLWNKGSCGVKFDDIYKRDACNHVLSGTIEIDQEVYGFIIEDGNWNGTVVIEWGDAEDVRCYEPPEPGEQLTLIPKDPFLHMDRPEMFEVYLYWRKQPWFTNMVNKYAYDRHFQPGCKVREFWEKEADKKGLKWGFLSDMKVAGRSVVTAEPFI